jgi:hypothetical protein
MDPVTISLIIKALDAAFLIGTYLIHRRESREHLGVVMAALNDVQSIKLRLENGTIDPEEAKERIERLYDTVLEPLRRAMDRL